MLLKKNNSTKYLNGLLVRSVENITRTIAKNFKKALSKVSQLVGENNDYYLELAQLNNEVERNLSSMSSISDGSYSVAMERYLLCETND